MLLHTEAPNEYGGQGIGKRLAHAVFTTLRAEGKRVIAKCPFMASYAARNPECAATSIMAAVHGGKEMLRWFEWDGTTMIVPERGFAWIDVVDAEGDTRLMTIRSILLVEDDAILATDLACSLADAGYEVLGPVMTSIAAVEVAEHAKPDLALVDINLLDGRAAGIEAARRIRDCGTPCFFITAYGAEARRSGFLALGLLEKPFSPEAALASVSAADALISGEVPRRVPRELELFQRPARSRE